MPLMLLGGKMIRILDLIDIPRHLNICINILVTTDSAPNLNKARPVENALVRTFFSMWDDPTGVKLPCQQEQFYFFHALIP